MCSNLQLLEIGANGADFAFPLLLAPLWFSDFGVVDAMGLLMRAKQNPWQLIAKNSTEEISEIKQYGPDGYFPFGPPKSNLIEDPLLDQIHLVTEKIPSESKPSYETSDNNVPIHLARTGRSFKAV